ncbi:MAG: hypothetical protein K8S87_05415 [Planctomycetes bacterium]|nr:hypothetical protein [Planctomycetota bacterium]
MKRKSFLLAVVVIIATISAIFVISYLCEKTDKITDSVSDDSNSSANRVKNDSDSKHTLIPRQKLNEFSTQANSAFTKFHKLESKFAVNRVEEQEFIMELCLIIEDIEAIDTKFNTDANIVDTKIYKNFDKFRIQVRIAFLEGYAKISSETVDFYTFWWEIDKARKFLQDEKSGAGRFIPINLLQNPELLTIFAQAETMINENAEKLEKISDESIQFVQNTLAMINETESDNSANSTVLAGIIADWQNLFTLLMPKITDVERDALIPRVKKAFYALEFAYFECADALKNEADFDFACKYFPFSQRLFSWIQNNYDVEHTKKKRVQNKVFSVCENFRHRFYNGFGLMNSGISFNVSDKKLSNMIILVDYLVFFTKYFAEDKTSKNILPLVNQWFATITSSVELTFSMETDDTARILRNMCLKSSYLQMLKRISHLKEISNVPAIIEKLEIEWKNFAPNIESALNSLINNKEFHFFELISLFTDSVALNAGEITNMLHQALLDKLNVEMISIELISDESLKNAAYAEKVAEIDALFNILIYLKYPDSNKLNLEIAKIIEPVSAIEVITAIFEDDNSIRAITSKLDKPASLVFIGLITDLYNNLLLTRKGTNDIDQTFINENLLTLKAYSKAYAKLADSLKTIDLNTFTNAYIFCKNYNNITKFSLIDQMLKDKRMLRTTLLNSLKNKYNNHVRMLTDLESLRMLKSLHNSIIKTTTSWTNWIVLKRIKSQIVNLTIKNAKNHLVFNGILMAEVFLEGKFFELLMKNIENQPSEIWIERAKWYLRNFSHYSSHKNIIDAKIKTLINR